MTTPKEHKKNLNLSFLSMLASAACAVHCLALPVILSLLPLTSSFFDNHLFEILLISTSFALAGFVLMQGFNTHRQKLPLLLLITALIVVCSGHIGSLHEFEPFFIITGSSLLALSQLVNFSFIRKYRSALAEA